MARDTIAFFSDYVCPFCYLGRTSLRRYRDSLEEPLEVEWHPFDLRARKRGPDGEVDRDVDDGKDEAYYERARENVRRLQEEYDVDMAREIATDVDSLNAQQASLFVRETRPERWGDFDEAVFEALWSDDRDVGDADVLVDVADDVGLDSGEIGDAIASDEWRDRLTDGFERARRSGVSGVPLFVFEDRVARGAVPPERLERLVEGE